MFIREKYIYLITSSPAPRTKTHGYCILMAKANKSTASG